MFVKFIFMPRPKTTKVVKVVKATRKPYVKVKSTKSYSKAKSLSAIVKGYSRPAPFPDKKIHYMRYSQSLLFTGGTAGTTGDQQSWRLNSCFDIDETSTGHQPYGHDELSLIYNRYKVLNTKVKMTWYDPSIDGMRFLYEVVNPASAGEFINALSPDKVQERATVGGGILSNTGSQKMVKTLNLPTYLTAGLTKLQFAADPDNFTAAVTGNPGSVCRLLMAVANTDNASGGTVKCIVEFVQTVEYYERKILTQS